ncbi:Hypothetical predicted protein, partial [Paramuricea clavata]
MEEQGLSVEEFPDGRIKIGFTKGIKSLNSWQLSGRLMPEGVIDSLKKLDSTIRGDPKNFWEKLDAFEDELEDLLKNYSDAD